MITRLCDPNGVIKAALLWLTLDETVVFPADLSWGRIESGAPKLATSHDLMVVLADDRHLGFVSLDGALIRVATFPDDHTDRWKRAVETTPAIILLRAPDDVTAYETFDVALNHAEVVVVGAISAEDRVADRGGP